MRKFLLNYSLKVKVPIVIFTVLTAFTVTYYFSYAERNNVGYAPEQPIAFSHKLHAGDMQIDCKYCHIGAEKTRFATVPSVDICMNCHTVARIDKPEIIKLTNFYKENKPILWKRIHRVPEFVYFNHSVHVNKGIDCVNCHGEISKMEVVGQVNSFTMGACLNCHRNPQENIQNFIELKNIKNGPQDCASCHR
jgi:hypothetical protein